MLDDVQGIIGLAWRKFEGACGEGWRLLSPDDHVDDKVTIVHLQEVDSFKIRLKLFGENWCVIGGDAE